MTKHRFTPAERDFLRLACPTWGAPEVARYLGQDYERLRRALDYLGIQSNRKCGRQKTADPTEEEFRQRVAEVQATWTPRQERHRRGLRVEDDGDEDEGQPVAYVAMRDWQAALDTDQRRMA